jgi:hypothetical protein
MPHYSFQDLRRRKAELKAEADELLQAFQQSAEPVFRTEPHKLFGQLFRLLVLPPAIQKGVSLISNWMSPKPRLGVAQASDRTAFWRQLIHQGVDVVLNALARP